MVKCKNCGTEIEEGARFCPNCGMRQETTGPKQPAAEQVEAPTIAGKNIKGNRALIWIVVAIVVVCFGVGACFGLNVGGVRDKVFGGNAGSSVSAASGSGDVSASKASSDDASDPEVRSSLNNYSWDEIAKISEKIGAASSKSDAVAIAAKYNLCGSDGSLSGRGSKSVELNDGKTYHVAIIGIYQDQKDDGSMAGLTFLFDEAVVYHPWSSTGFATGGWKASEIRSYLSTTVYPLLPEDLKSSIATVRKKTNNTGAASSGTLSASVVTETDDNLFLLSLVEVCGTSESNRRWVAPYTEEQWAWCDDVTRAEGEQYDLYKETNVETNSTNSVLVKTIDGDAAKWWLRSPNPHIENDTLGVDAAGTPNDDAGPIEQWGIVPAFCI